MFFVPELKNNLLSIGQLQERELAILIQHGKLKIYHPEKGLILRTEMTANRMFVLLADSTPQNSDCLYTSTQDLAISTFMALSIWTFKLQRVENSTIQENGEWDTTTQSSINCVH